MEEDLQSLDELRPPCGNCCPLPRSPATAGCGALGLVLATALLASSAPRQCANRRVEGGSCFALMAAGGPERFHHLVGNIMVRETAQGFLKGLLRLCSGGLEFCGPRVPEQVHLGPQPCKGVLQTGLQLCPATSNDPRASQGRLNALGVQCQQPFLAVASEKFSSSHGLRLRNLHQGPPRHCGVCLECREQILRGLLHRNLFGTTVLLVLTSQFPHERRRQSLF
mmetsp:Transcript_75003/g.243773  ORF Transcript_75003/g.243773 Transcript_75003/m.243773 type:complete len:224 (-) Transcript_75003:1721-2392(-)